MIYKYCLVVGKVFPYTFSERYADLDYTFKDTRRVSLGYEVPEVQILRVCKAVYREAEEMLYQKNTFVLPTRNLTARFFETSLNTEVRRAWVKSLEVTLDSADMTEKDRITCWEDINPPPEGLEDIYYVFHERYKDQLVRKDWPQKLKNVLDFLLLDKIVVDLSERICCKGRCKVVGRDTREAFFSGFAMGMPKVMEIRHVDNPEEYKSYIAKRTAKRRQLILGGMNCEA